MTTLPREWKMVRLAELGMWTGGGTPSKAVASFWSHGTIPWVSPKDMKSRVISDAEDHITDEAVRGSATNVVPTGSVLVVTRSGILRHSLPVALTCSDVAINQDLKALIPRPGVSAAYVAWALRWRAQSILAGCAKEGTTVQSIETNRLLDFEIPVAPTEEQSWIVAAIDAEFSRIDAGLAALESARRRLRTYWLAMQQDVLGHGQPRVRLSSLVEGTIGGTWGESTPTSASNTEVRVVRGAEFRNWAEQRAKNAPRRWVRDKQAAARVLREGDLVLEVSGGGPDQPVGRTILIDKDALASTSEPLVPSNFCRRLQLSRQVWPPFIQFQLQYQYQMGGTIPYQAATTNIRNLSVKDYLAGSLVWAPELREQQRVASAIDEYLRELAIIEDACAKSAQRGSTLRSAILDAAFSGQLGSPVGTASTTSAAERSTGDRPTQRGTASGGTKVTG